MDDQGIWQKIDDEKSTQISSKEADELNKQGVLYVLKRRNETQSSKDDQENKVITKSSKNTIPPGRDVANKHTVTEKQIPNINLKFSTLRENDPMDRTVNKKSYVDKDGFTLIDHSRTRRNPWHMEPKTNPWSRESKPEYPKPEAANKRYYVDRDQPSETKKKICWWHQRNRCKFGKNCWYSHKELPFRGRAQ